MQDLQIDFQIEVYKIIRQLDDSYGLIFESLTAIILNMSAIEATTLLINQKEPYKEFYDLLKIGRLDLSLERIILEIKYINLFDEKTVINAMNRLKNFS